MDGTKSVSNQAKATRALHLKPCYGWRAASRAERSTASYLVGVWGRALTIKLPWVIKLLAHACFVCGAGKARVAAFGVGYVQLV